MNTIERIKMVKAMEYIARQINNEDGFEMWLLVGVADGDIEYGDLSVKPEDTENLECYINDDESFSEIMETFLKLMKRAKSDGGLYCDGVVSK